ncbi:MAG TPA: hypothetical protein DDZ78_05585, partial [Porphyromonadaceae bacterium]|nr:hypothetical protein [Porphyromonadaceae bacterium]
MKNRIIEAVIIAFGLFLLGASIKSGIKLFSQRDRVVNVKGLAEREIPADKVIWPLAYKEVGNDLGVLYNNLSTKNQTVKSFLIANGIKEEEISISAPQIVDMEAERYGNNQSPYRYNITSVITVSSDNVDQVRKLIGEQGELLKQGIAVAGGDYQYQVQYSFTQLNDIKPQMIEEATKNAREAAVKFAEDSNSKLGK